MDRLLDSGTSFSRLIAKRPHDCLTLLSWTYYSYCCMLVCVLNYWSNLRRGIGLGVTGCYDCSISFVSGFIYCCILCHVVNVQACSLSCSVNVIFRRPNQTGRSFIILLYVNESREWSVPQTTLKEKRRRQADGEWRWMDAWAILELRGTTVTAGSCSLSSHLQLMLVHGACSRDQRGRSFEQDSRAADIFIPFVLLFNANVYQFMSFVFSHFYYAMSIMILLHWSIVMWWFCFTSAFSRGRLYFNSVAECYGVFHAPAF